MRRSISPQIHKAPSKTNPPAKASLIRREGEMMFKAREVGEARFLATVPQAETGE